MHIYIYNKETYRYNMPYQQNNGKPVCTVTRNLVVEYNHQGRVINTFHEYVDDCYTPMPSQSYQQNNNLHNLKYLMLYRLLRR